MAHRSRRVMLIVGITFLSLHLLQLERSAGVAEAQSGCQRFPTTGHTLCGRFLQYWQQHGGLAQQGYPLTEPFSEMSDTDGKIYTVQYFERAVFEAHPENRAPNDVLLALLGTFRYKERYPIGAPRQVPNTEAGSVMFKEAGKRLGGAFLQYWQKNGGLARQGYPISDEFLETSATDSKVYKVQYFERAVFEYHPEKAAPYDVLLSLLGSFRLRDKHGDGVGLPQAPDPVFESGGLGLSRVEWEKVHGRAVGDDIGGIVYANGYSIGYSSDSSAAIAITVGRTFSPAVTVQQARAESKKVIPADAQLVGTEDPAGGVMYDTYYSASLAALFPSDTPDPFPHRSDIDIWNGARPGTFTVKFDITQAGGGVRIVLMYIFVGTHG